MEPPLVGEPLGEGVGLKAARLPRPPTAASALGSRPLLWGLDRGSELFSSG